MEKAKFILNTLERIVVVLMFLGVGFKILNWPGASILVLLGGILFLIVSFTKLIRTKTNNNWTLKYKWSNVFTILQTEFNNGYLVALVEVRLAALVIPFHSMVEHNLYSNLESNNDE